MSSSFLVQMDDSSLTNEEIIRLIKSHDGRLTFTKQRASSSQVWLAFSYVHIDDRKQDFLSRDQENIEIAGINLIQISWNNINKLTVPTKFLGTEIRAASFQF
jgi:ribosome biogenesis protein Tsr3